MKKLEIEAVSVVVIDLAILIVGLILWPILALWIVMHASMGLFVLWLSRHSTIDDWYE